jgi:hypothetical protein
MKTSTNIIAYVAVASCVAVVAGIYGLIGIGTMEKADNYLYKGATAPMSVLLRVAADYPKMAVETRDAILASDAAEAAEASLKIDATRGDLERSLAQYGENLADASLGRAETSPGLAETSPGPSEGKVVTDEGRLSYEKFLAAWRAYSPMINQVAATAQAGQASRAVAMLRASQASADAVQSSLDAMIACRLADGATAASRNAALARSSSALNLAIVALGLLVSTASGLAMAHSVGKRIRAGEETLGTIRKILGDEPIAHPAPDAAILPKRGLVLLPRPAERKPMPSFHCFSPKLRLLAPIHEEV